MEVKKGKEKGFTLIEILAVVFIIALVLGIGTYGVTVVIRNSNEKSYSISVNNIKGSSVSYVNERYNGVNWISGEDGEVDSEFTCVSVSSLINYGYYSDNDLDKLGELSDKVNGYKVENDSYIKINRDISSKAIVSEELSDDSDIVCSNYYVKVPDSSICNKLEYNGLSQKLISYDNEYYTYYNNSGVNAGSYSVILKLRNDSVYYWNDGTSEDKNVTCSINPKKINVYFREDYEFYDSEFDENKKYIGSNIEDIMDNYLEVFGLVVDENNNSIHSPSIVKIRRTDDKVRFDDIKIVDKNNNDVTGNYDPNYLKSRYISIKEIEAPTAETICLNPVYNGKKLILAKSGKGYDLSSNSGVNAGIYKVNVSLDFGYRFVNSSVMNEYGVYQVECSILKAESSIELSDNKVSYPSDKLVFDNNGVTIKGTTSKNVTFKYYTGSSCDNSTVMNGSPTNVGTYYGIATVSEDENHNGATSNCAKLEVKREIYTIKYDANGGIACNPSSVEVGYGEVYGNLCKTTRVGYKFDGWYNEVNEKVSSNTVMNQTFTVELTAKWEPITYTVKYNANGGTGTMSSSSHTYDVDSNLTKNGFTREGYTFDGWNTKSDGSGTSYSNGASVENLTATNGATVNLYAKWERITYSVSLVSKCPNGISSTNNVKINSGSTLGTQTTPVCQGYIFIGYKDITNNKTYTYGNYWNEVNSARESYVAYRGSGGFKGYDHNFPITVNGNITLEAQWEAVALVQYNTNGGFTSNFTYFVADDGFVFNSSNNIRYYQLWRIGSNSKSYVHCYLPYDGSVSPNGLISAQKDTSLALSKNGQTACGYKATVNGNTYYYSYNKTNDLYYTTYDIIKTTTSADTITITMDVLYGNECNNKSFVSPTGNSSKMCQNGKKF